MGMNQAFLAIDGEDGNGQISLREFEDAYRAMGCRKFQGPNEMERLRAVFRFLDPSGEGQVSKDEFTVLSQMFNEILLSIEEFVEFCVRNFGHDPEDTWNFIDADQSGECDEDEWRSACESLGYMGPVMPIYRYLDKDDEGTVTLEVPGSRKVFQQMHMTAPWYPYGCPFFNARPCFLMPRLCV